MKKITHIYKGEPELERELRDIVNLLNEIVDSLAVPGSSFPGDSSKTSLQVVKVRDNLFSLAVKSSEGTVYSLPGLFVKTSSIPQTATAGQTIEADANGNFTPA
jgi:hypothetical protein